ncbi:hypothetical protein CBS101457_002287 [Exobasidium rhododendri]|nr:hypothetical protein CBS101457_002287 [Exobasidium rhododendri]
MTTGQSLVVVGLMSGGKDSCYNLCHCAKLGHRVAALATLAPPQGKDELDSYMYQTVGHDAIHLIAEAMELPLYRTTITGQAINQTSTYGQRLASTSSHTLDVRDETEDLFTLLRMVKEAQPEINAVSVGAILSNYQRIRVEHVALRLGLQMMPLSFLWQRDQAELLDEMCQAGMNSVLIKVAGAGLGEVDLLKSLAQMKHKLHKLHSIYGAHICGEGGEYETFTLDCPLFKRRICIDQKTTIIHSDSSFASVFYLRIDAAHLEDKVEGATTLGDVTVPPLLDSLSEKTLKRCEEAERRCIRPTAVRTIESHAYRAPAKPPVTRIGHWCAIGGIVGLPVDLIKDEFQSAFDALLRTLADHSLSSAHLTHINVYLSSQAHFSQLNEVYKACFGVDPPSRACVAINLDEQSRHHIILDGVAYDDGVLYKADSAIPSIAPRPRKALHVQGRSYWAAANIGPYSQSVLAESRISIAGQIGLLPTTLQLASHIPVQIVLALQHARRVFKATLEARAAKQKGWIEGCVCWLDDARWLPLAREAWHAQGLDADDEDADEDGDRSGWEAEWIGRGLTIHQIPITFIVLNKGALPRSAAVEWQLFAHDGKSVAKSTGGKDEGDTEGDDDEDDDDDDDDNDNDGDAPLPICSNDMSFHLATFSGSCFRISCRKGSSSLAMAHLNKKDGANDTNTTSVLSLQPTLCAKVFYTQEEHLELRKCSLSWNASMVC